MTAKARLTYFKGKFTEVSRPLALRSLVSALTLRSPAARHPPRQVGRVDYLLHL